MAGQAQGERNYGKEKQFTTHWLSLIYSGLPTMKINKHFWIAAILFAGCGSGQVASGKKVFYYNESDGVATLDPAFAKNRSIMWVVHQLYSTLVETDDQLRFVPALARSWEVSADRRVWTFHLRNDVVFSDDPAFPGKGAETGGVGCGV